MCPPYSLRSLSWRVHPSAEPRAGTAQTSGAATSQLTAVRACSCRMDPASPLTRPVWPFAIHTPQSLVPSSCGPRAPQAQRLGATERPSAADLTGCVAQVTLAAAQPPWTHPVYLEGLPANHAKHLSILTSLHGISYLATNIVLRLPTAVLRSLFYTTLLMLSHQSALSQACRYDWDSPHAFLASSGRPAYVETPSVVVTRAGTVLLGSPSLVWSSAHRFAPTMSDSADYIDALSRNLGFVGFVTRADDAGSPIDPPVMGRPMYRPLAATTTDGSLHAAWIEQPRRASNDSVELWHAERRGTTWSVPQHLLSASRINWDVGRSALVTVGTDVHIVTTFVQNGAGGGIAYARRVRGVWSLTTSLVDGLPSAVDAILTQRDSLVIAYAAGDVKAKTRNGSHVFLARLAVTDTTWPTAKRIQWSGLASVGWPTLLQSPRNSRSIVLSYAVTQRGMDGADSIFAMTSPDGGATWGAPSGTRLPASVKLVRFAMDGQGSAHLVGTVTQRPPNKSAAFLAASYWGGEWSAAEFLAFGQVASEPTFFRVGQDSLLLSWGRAIPDTGAGGRLHAVPAGAYAYLVGHCRHDQR
jgi:hypothetical protein